MNEKKYYVYIITNTNNTVLYIGVTGNLRKRLYEHKNKLDEESFASQNNLIKLVHFEEYDDSNRAIAREKQLKHWNRKWKERLIRKSNPYWRDLSENLDFE